MLEHISDGKGVCTYVSEEPDVVWWEWLFHRDGWRYKMKFQLLIKAKMLKHTFRSDAVFILLINVEMPTTVGILTFMSKINSKPSLV